MCSLHLYGAWWRALRVALGAGLGTLALGLVLTVQTTYVLGQLPGAPAAYRQFAQHVAWSSGNAGCAQ